MPEIVVMRGNDGKLCGLGEKHHASLVKFKRMLHAAAPGETFAFSYKVPRSPQHHRWFFARVNELLGMQETFTDMEHLMVFLKVGAGFVEFMPGTDGQLVAVPKSIAWHTLDEREFTEVRMAMQTFLWTQQAQAALWPRLNPDQRYAMVDTWFRG